MISSRSIRFKHLYLIKKQMKKTDIAEAEIDTQLKELDKSFVSCEINI